VSQSVSLAKSAVVRNTLIRRDGRVSSFENKESLVLGPALLRRGVRVAADFVVLPRIESHWVARATM
jgi:hypothetical protein